MWSRWQVSSPMSAQSLGAGPAKCPSYACVWSTPDCNAPDKIPPTRPPLGRSASSSAPSCTEPSREQRLSFRAHCLPACKSTCHWCLVVPELAAPGSTERLCLGAPPTSVPISSFPLLTNCWPRLRNRLSIIGVGTLPRPASLSPPLGLAAVTFITLFFLFLFLFPPLLSLASSYPVYPPPLSVERQLKLRHAPPGNAQVPLPGHQPQGYQ
jgi:hypothetical protein